MLWLVSYLFLFHLSTSLVVYTNENYVIEHRTSAIGLVCNGTTADRIINILSIRL